MKLNEGMSLFEVQTYGIEYLVSQSIYLQYYYPHEKLLSKGTNPQEVSTLRDRVYKSWVRENSFGENLKDLRDYFGEKLALYFAFCIFYRNWLNVCAIAGLVVFAYGGWDYSQSSGSSEDRAWRRLYDNKANNI